MRLSPHFTKEEMRCPCCLLYIENKRLLYALEKLRKECGDVPITVLSCCRCEGWNSAVGGVPASKHILGMAADVVVSGLHPLEMASKAEKVHAFSHGGIGTYPDKGFIHVDVRKNHARWTG